MGLNVSLSARRSLNALIWLGQPFVCFQTFSTSPVTWSGHSKWSTIRHDKAKADSRKNKARNVFARDIVNSTRLYGADPKFNGKLATAIANAKSTGMSKQSIDGAILRGQGKSADGRPLESVTLEAMFLGTKPIALVVEGEFESKAMALQEIRLSLKKSGARESPSLFMFERRGRVVLDFRQQGDEESIMETAMSTEGCLDVNTDEEKRLVIDTEPDAVKAMENSLIRDLGVGVQRVEPIWHPKEDSTVVGLDEEQTVGLESLTEKLQEFPGVQKVWTNFRNV